MKNEEKVSGDGKLGFRGLTALVFGLMVGLGIYNLPENLAAVASPGAVALAWIVTAAGILPLVISFNWLSNHFPQYNAGIYQYPQAEFGNYAGFNIAWGYWLCTAFSNIANAIMLNDAFGAFFPSLLNHGWETILFCSALIWLMYFIVARGIQTADIINSLLALIKVLMICFIIGIFVIFFKADLFDADIWGKMNGLGSIPSQIKETMMITLFCFFGVEGAVMMSARAKRASDVGKAGFTGFFLALLLYMSISLLCFGLMSRAELIGVNDPSIAYILKAVCGEWAYWFVIISVIVSLLGGWVAWTLIVAQVPYEASLSGIMPKCFKRLNRNGMPAFGLMASSIVMELFLLLVVMADNVYLTALHITGLMVIPCYFFTGLFMLKKAKQWPIRIIAIITSLFCIWMTYAGGFLEMLMTSVFYIIGTAFFIKARRESEPGKPVFSPVEKVSFGLLCLASVITIAMLIHGISGS